METHHTEVSIAASVSWVFVERAVLSGVVFPGAMEVIGHDMDEVQVPEVRIKGCKAFPMAISHTYVGILSSSTVKNSPANAGDTGSEPG